MPRRSVSLVQWVQLWDGRWTFARVQEGLPTFEFHAAPLGLATRRQLRARGLAPGGYGPVAQISWRKRGCGPQFALLYRVDVATPKRTATPAQRHAIRKALAARRVCRSCGPVDHYVRTALRLCSPCFRRSEAV